MSGEPLSPRDGGHPTWKAGHCLRSTSRGQVGAGFGCRNAKRPAACTGDIHTDTYSLQNSRASRPGADIHRNPDTDTHVPRSRCAQIRTGTHRHLGRDTQMHRQTDPGGHRGTGETPAYRRANTASRPALERPAGFGRRPRGRAQTTGLLGDPSQAWGPCPPILVPGLRTILEAAFRGGQTRGALAPLGVADGDGEV